MTNISSNIGRLYAKLMALPEPKDDVFDAICGGASVSVIDDIAAERLRQVSEEGFDCAHDDKHVAEELANAAACYATGTDVFWPETWSIEWFKRSNRRRELIKAAALLIAEIERIDRAGQL